MGPLLMASAGSSTYMPPACHLQPSTLMLCHLNLEAHSAGTVTSPALKNTALQTEYHDASVWTHSIVNNSIHVRKYVTDV